jgi:RND family efflux transporter MFP subunit
MTKTSKRVIAVIVLAGFGSFVGYRIWQAYENKEKAEKATTQPRGGPGTGGRVVAVSVAAVRSGSVREEIEITGALKPKEQVDVTTQVTGRVQSLTLQVGDFVRQGQVIAQLEDAELGQQVRRAEAAQAIVRANQQQRQAELANARADLERAQKLLDAGLLSRQEFETKQTGFRVIESQIALTGAQAEQALAERRELQLRMQQMRIVSPMSGYVAQRFVDVGAVVSPSTPIVRVVNLSTLVTLANVPEGQVSKLRVGNRAIVNVDAFGDRAFEGRIARVAPVLDPATRSASVEVEIPNPTGALKAEMFARVKLDLGVEREAVLIPREALVYRGQQPGVYVVAARRPEFRSIETGSTQGQHVEVISNLAAGTRIVSRGAAMLTEGDQIRVVEDKEAERGTPKTPPKDPGAGDRRQSESPAA